VCAAAARSCDVTREMPVRVSGLGARCRHTRLASCPLSVTLTRRVTVAVTRRPVRLFGAVAYTAGSVRRNSETWS
jgi:hypothetical protein